MEKEHKVNFREYLTIFQQVTRMTSTILDHQEVMDTVVRRLPEILRLDAATIRLLDTSTRTFVLGAAHGLSLEYLSRDSIDTEETMATIRAGLPVVGTHLDRDPAYCDRELIRNEGIKSILSLPILFQGTNIGVMRLLSRQDRIFSDDEISFSMALAEQVGIAISNARLFTEMENQIDFLKEVHAVTRLLNTTLDLDAVLRMIVEKVHLGMHHKGCAVRLVQAHSNRLEQVAAHGMSAQFIAETGSRDMDLSRLSASGEPLAIYDVATDPRLHHRELLLREGVRSLLIVPIRGLNKVIGVLEVFTDMPHCFTSSEVSFVKTVAQAGSFAIRNARTYRQITLLFNQLEENERFLADILNCLRVQLLVVDSGKHLVMANQVFLDHLRVSEEEILGMEYEKVFHDAAIDMENCPVEKVLTSGKAAYSVYRRCSADGAECWFEHSATPMFGDDRRVEYVIEVIRDVTLRRRLEEERLKRTRLQGMVETAGGVAHEINSPLFAALGTAQLLRDDLEDDDQRRDMDIIIRNLEVIGELTGKMISATGFERRRYVGDREMIDLRQGA